MEEIILKNKLLKYLLILLNAFFSSYIWVLINNILSKISLDILDNISFEIFYLSNPFIKVAFIFSIVPQIILYFISKKLKINKYIDLGLILFMGFIIFYLYFYFVFGNISLKEYIIHGYEYYLSTIISGVIFRIVLYKINKINIKK